jgi:hypothetical protein
MSAPSPNQTSSFVDENSYFETDCQSEDTGSEMMFSQHSRDVSEQDQSQHLLHPDQQQQILPNSCVITQQTMITRSQHINLVHLQSSGHQSSQAEPMMFAHPCNTGRVTASNSSPLLPAASLPFLSLEPPLSEDDYNFALEASEGIADLFEEDLPPF